MEGGKKKLLNPIQGPPPSSYESFSFEITQYQVLALDESGYKTNIGR
jgi:hypothetical protein